MSTVVTLPGRDTAERLIPLLRDYGTKLGTLNERAADIIAKMFQPHNLGPVARPWEMEAARLICLRETLEKTVTIVAQNASGLLEHAELEHVIWLELKLRLDELEEHLLFSSIVVDNLKQCLKVMGAKANAIREQIEAIRPGAPF